MTTIIESHHRSGEGAESAMVGYLERKQGMILADLAGSVADAGRSCPGLYTAGMGTPRSTRDPLFLGRWFQDEVIIVAVRWYLTYPLSYRQVCEMLRDRGVSVAPSTVMCWVLRYAPEFEKRWRRYEKPVALSWRMDETYIKVAGQRTYLYRAVDQNGKTVDFFLSKRRDVGAAKTSLRQALRKHGDPLSITLDAYEASHRVLST